MSSKSTLAERRTSYESALQRRIVELSVSRRLPACRRTERAERALEDASLDRLRCAVLTFRADHHETPAPER